MTEDIIGPDRPDHRAWRSMRPIKGAENNNDDGCIVISSSSPFLLLIVISYSCSWQQQH
jgi:hypothetical protein